MQGREGVVRVRAWCLPSMGLVKSGRLLGVDGREGRGRARNSFPAVSLVGEARRVQTERDWSGTTLATAKDFETREERREEKEGEGQEGSAARPTRWSAGEKDEGVSFSAQNCN